MGRLHPKVSLLFELNTLPLKWEGMKRCIEFWVKVMRMGEDRLLKQVMMQVMELGDGVWWRQDACVEVKCKWRRRVLVQLRGGTVLVHRPLCASHKGRCETKERDRFRSSRG